MLAAKAGSIAIAAELVAHKKEFGFKYTNIFGESAIFFALVNEHWEFLRYFGQQKQLKLKKNVRSLKCPTHSIEGSSFLFSAWT
jgi:hypothetical protein